MAKESGRSGGRAQSVENREHWQYDLICNKPKRGGSMRRLLLLALLAMLLLASAQAKEVALAALQGNAWHDLDYDGLQDPGEPGLANVQVVLLDGSGNPLTPVQIGGLPVATQTDADGAYQFTVPSGRQYRVKYSPSSGLFFSPKDQGSDDTKDSDADPATGQTDAIATIPGQSYPGWDAGIYENEIIINEIYPNPTGSDNRDGVISWERVELKNIGSSDCNIGQWSIEDDEGTLYTIPAGTTLPAGGYLVVHIGGYSVGISNSAGDPVILYNFARQEMERVVCPVCSKKEGLSYSCLPDASENWDFRGEPTFGGDLSETSLPGAVNAVQDYGDAPASTGTTRAQNGPRHFILGPHLGSLVDNEPDGQPGSNANGDDTTGQDDEDGVTFSDLIVGQSSTFDVTASASGILQAWMDFNGDGAFDNSAERIVTDQSLTAGEHSLSFSVPSGAEVGFTYARFRLSSSSGLSPLGPAADGEVEDYQVEIKQKYILGDRVWEDLNGDGLQDAAEPGVDSAVVNLRDEQNNLVASQTTSGGGYYEFINPLPGTYTLEFLPPQGYLFTQKDVGPDDEKDSDADPATHLAGPVTVVLDQSKSTWDAGLCHFASISGCKFEDKDGDGQRDSDEPGLKDWTITLCKPDESEITATTDENGFYSFTNLPPGSYNVNEVQQYGWIQTAPALESEGDTHYNVTLSGTNVTNKNFGNRGALSVCGSKIYDLNGNGLWDEGEPGLQGWEIQLKDGNGAIVQTITGTDGAYGFPNLEPTTYIVSEVQKNFWVQTALLESSYTLNLANGDFHDKNFTNRGTLSISGIKFSDINGNGVRDQNEPLLPDWQIQLRDNQDLLLKTVSTSNDTATLGAYTFTNLGPGVYKLTEISQNGWVQTAPPGGQHTVELVNANVEGKDFGNNRLAIYGYKFQDINGNGQKEENEPYLLGWEIKLKDGSGNEQTMTTSSEPGQEGRYSFSGLQPGAYKVSEVQKPGWVRTTPTEESYDVQLSTQAVGPVIFGNRGTLSISGMKFEDMNGNGQKDADETGLKDWTIRLQSPQIIETNTTTGQDGSYQFQNLPPGDYTISELLQSGWVQTAPPGGQHTVELVNANVEGKDFGNNRLAIYGYKFQDINDNGQKEENEPYLLGWEIKLKDGNGNEQTVTTSSEPGQEGRYSFSGLQPGAYKVSEVQKPGWVRTIPAEESYDVQLSTQAVGPVIFGNRGTLSISGMKFHDRNANSQKDEDELPLSDWEIQLRDGNGVVQTVKTSAKPGEEGGYEFVNLQPGTYTVTEEQRTGWVQTVPTEDGYSITLTNQPVRGKIFGNNMLAISGICFLDSNGNSQRDQDESPFSGWEIQLKDGSGNVLQTATTSFGPGSEGRYEFMNLAPGTYRVSESPRAGWIRTFPQDEDHVVTLTNKRADGIDFGNRGTLSISGMKFEDLNGNGQKDADETGLQDWTIRLQSPQIIETTTTTGQDGSYQFQNLPPGDYTISELLQSGWVQTSPADGSYLVNLKDADVFERDFGNRKLIEAFQVLVTANPQTILPGQEITFTITINSQGEILPESLGAENTLPEGLKFVSSNPGPLSVTENVDGTTTLTWTDLAFGSLIAAQAAQTAESQATSLNSASAPSPSTSITITAQAHSGAPESLTSTVVVTGSSSQAAVASATSQACVKCLKLQSVPVKLNKTSDLKEVWPGATVGYNITYSSMVDIALTDVVIVEQSSPDLIFISATPAPDTETSTVWTIGELQPHASGTISVLFLVKDAENLSFGSQSHVQGNGFMNRYRRLSTDTIPSSIQNSVSLSSKEFGSVTASNSVRLRDAKGTSILKKEHGSGNLQSEELSALAMKNKTVEVNSSLEAVYLPTAFDLPRRSLDYNSRLSSLTWTKNRATDASTSQEYRYADSLALVQQIRLDKNGTDMATEGSVLGQTHLSIRKKEPTELKHPSPIFESTEDYSGAFRFNQRLEDFGLNVKMIRNVTGLGWASSDQRLKKSQRSYEHGAGSYQSEVLASTAESYIAKDLNVIYDPQYGYGKWKAGIWSKSPGQSYLGQEITGADFIHEETEAEGLSDMSTNLSFLGKGMLRAVSKSANSELDLDEEYMGQYSLQRKVHLGGVSHFDRPHLTLNKTGRLVPGTTAADYTITVLNDGNAALGPVYVWDIFPAGTDFLSSSLKPDRLQKSYANWSLLYLGIGQSLNINLRLNVTDQRDELVNVVYASGGHNREWVTAGNMSTIQFGWLECCSPQMLVEKQARSDAADSRLIWYRILLKNQANVSLVARIMDRLPTGLQILNASAQPQVEGLDLAWVTTAIPAGETRFIEYRAQATKNGKFVNTARVEAHALDGSGGSSTEASASVQVGEATSYTEDGWRPPEWGLDRSEMICDDEIAGACSSCPSCSCSAGE